MKRYTINLFLLIFSVYSAASGSAKLAGNIIYYDKVPVPGAVIYSLDKSHRLQVRNNIIMIADNIPRTISNREGQFNIEIQNISSSCIFVLDLEDNSGFYDINSFSEQQNPINITLNKSAVLKGRFLKLDKSVDNVDIIASYICETNFLKYFHTTSTDNNGSFEFDSLMPGRYLVSVRQKVPQVGCCFNSVVVKQCLVEMKPNDHAELTLGGTDLPYLHGIIKDNEGDPLHGVWINLVPKGQENKDNTAAVWSDVTKRDGSYEIYDIPEGEYTVNCFRRLAQNSSSRVIDITEEVTITGNGGSSLAKKRWAENIFDLQIDLSPFMPLQIGEAVTNISATTIGGDQFELNDYKGKIVVLYFYTTWCNSCLSSMPRFAQIYDNFKSKNVVVVGINLDKNILDCKKNASEKRLNFPIIFAGPWSKSKIAKDFRVVNVPTSFIIDPKGNLSQRDLFGSVLENHIKTLFGK